MSVIETKMKNKALVLVDKEHLEEFKKLGVSNFLFPLKGFSVGYREYTFEEISGLEADVYMLINRILTDRDIDEFLKMQVPQNVKGFLIEDVGLMEELRGSRYELINFQNHLNNNYMTINYWLKYYDSLVISTDITEEEIDVILKNADKKLVAPVFGYQMIMYSRRKLISNYYEYHGLEPRDMVSIEDTKGDFLFQMNENDYGTACFDGKILDIREEMAKYDDKIKFYLYNFARIDLETSKDALNGEQIKDTTKGFIDKKTVFRIGDLK